MTPRHPPRALRSLTTPIRPRPEPSWCAEAHPSRSRQSQPRQGPSTPDSPGPPRVSRRSASPSQRLSAATVSQDCRASISKVFVRVKHVATVLPRLLALGHDHPLRRNEANERDPLHLACCVTPTTELIKSAPREPKLPRSRPLVRGRGSTRLACPAPRSANLSQRAQSRLEANETTRESRLD